MPALTPTTHAYWAHERGGQDPAEPWVADADRRRLVPAGRTSRPQLQHGVHSSSRRAVLLGAPDLPFSMRWNLTTAEVSHMASWVLLGILTAMLLRISSAEHRRLWQATAACFLVTGADLAWRRDCRGAPSGGSWARWRGLVWPVMALGDILLSRLLVVRVVFDTLQPPTEGGTLAALAQLAALLVASRLPTTAVMLLQCQRIFIVAPTQAVMLFFFLKSNAAACASTALDSPLAASVARHVAEAIGSSQVVAFLAFPVSAGAAPAAEQCQAVLAYLQGVGVLAPLLLAAAVEARMFASHERQRRQAGLPPEPGWQARVYHCVAAALDRDWRQLAAGCWLLSGALYIGLFY